MAIPCGPLNTIPDVAADPQIQFREMFAEVVDYRQRKIKVSNTPIKLTRTPAKLGKGAPGLGEHTREILSAMLGMDEAGLNKLEGNKIIASLQDNGE